GSHGTWIESRPGPCRWRATWVEQDSNLRRQCHQIYSLAPLAAWVSTRESRSRPVVFGLILVSRRPSNAGATRSTRRAIRGAAELAVRLELTTLGLQNPCPSG